MKVLKLLLKLTIIISLLVNSAGQGYMSSVALAKEDALRPTSSACSGSTKSKSRTTALARSIRSRISRPIGFSSSAVSQFRKFLGTAKGIEEIAKISPIMHGKGSANMNLSLAYDGIMDGSISIEDAASLIMSEVFPFTIHEREQFKGFDTAIDILSIAVGAGKEEDPVKRVISEFYRETIELLKRHRKKRSQRQFKHELSKLVLERKVFSLFWISRSLYHKTKEDIAQLERDIANGNNLKETPLNFRGREGGYIRVYRNEVMSLYDLMYTWHKINRGEFGNIGNAFFSWIQLFDDDATKKAFLYTDIDTIQLYIENDKPVPGKLINSVKEDLKRCEKELAAAALILASGEVLNKWSYFDAETRSNYPVTIRELNGGRDISFEEAVEVVKQRFPVASKNIENDIRALASMYPDMLETIKRTAARFPETVQKYKVRLTRNPFKLAEDEQKRRQIRERNIKYLKGSKLLEPIESLPYDTVFLLEDEKMTDLMDQLLLEEEWSVGISRMLMAPISIRNTDNIESTKREKALASISENMVSIAHLLQSVYLYSQGRDDEAFEAQIQARITAPKNGVFRIFATSSLSDPYYNLANRIYRGRGVSRERARYLCQLALKLYNARVQNQFDVDDISNDLAQLEMLQQGKGCIKLGKMSVALISDKLALDNSAVSRQFKLISETDTEIGKTLKEHFKMVREETMRASRLVYEPGDAVVLGSGSFTTLPIAEMLKEK